MNVELLFDKNSAEFGKFNSINSEEKLHNDPMICALLYLDSIYPGEIHYHHSENGKGLFIHGLNFNIDDLVNKDVLYLIRCGVKYDRESDNLVFMR